jgi:hypothetical protein
VAGERTLYALPGILDGLLACLQVQLADAAANGGPPEPERYEIRPGPLGVPYLSTKDDQCKCGIAMVWLRSIEQAETGEDGPLTNANGDLCGPQQYTVNGSMSVQRCPALGDEHNNPTAAQTRTDAFTQLYDQRAMLRALKCCFGELFAQPIFDQWTPIEPEGMCFGGVTEFTITLDDCNDCDDPEE